MVITVLPELHGHCWTVKAIVMAVLLKLMVIAVPPEPMVIAVLPEPNGYCWTAKAIVIAVLLELMVIAVLPELNHAAKARGHRCATKANRHRSAMIITRC